MTAEIAIMNRSAIALAADSAVTVTQVGEDKDGNRIYRQKIYSNANKLFELVKGRPIGIMIYNNAELLDVPWETLIKLFREENRDCVADSVDAYFERFISFLSKNTDRFFPVEAQVEYFEAFMRAFVDQFLNTFSGHLQHMATERSIRLTKGIKRQTIESLLDRLLVGWQKVKRAPWSRDLPAAELNEIRRAILELMPDEAEGFLLLAKHKRQLRDAATLALLCATDPPSWTGLVVAGFGQGEPYPSLCHMKISGVVGNRLMILGQLKRSVDSESGAMIMPFAQSAEAQLFLTGVDPEVADAIGSFWSEVTTKLPHAISKIVSDTGASLTDAQEEAVNEALETFGGAIWDSFAEYMNRFHEDTRISPISAGARFMAKSDLAELSEALVNLATLRARVSIDRSETVGGATDVAVISPGDGFVWIKRKHYFDLSLNPFWAVRHGVEHVPCPQDSRGGY
ncbi:hypothetical protein [Fodinicola acaciae]|uniref:hypothetical protein n=1 Tax=Fodinicola acaciae TaxID=2681555 RepID=UPI0013D57CBB|nr:hypothetical protein [Fodinicola acaciae]